MAKVLSVALFKIVNLVALMGYLFNIISMFSGGGSYCGTGMYLFVCHYQDLFWYWDLCMQKNILLTKITIPLIMNHPPLIMNTLLLTLITIPINHRRHYQRFDQSCLTLPTLNINHHHHWKLCINMTNQQRLDPLSMAYSMCKTILQLHT